MLLLSLDGTEKERFRVDWIGNSKDVVAQFGWNESKAHPCTFGLNERAGMTAEELQKYMENSIFPLYPDVEDIPGKRVIIKADSGPGRMNVDMLAGLKVRGVYLTPGVPNTTGKTQETDQNYAMFKTSFRDNLRVLTQARHDKGFSIQVPDISLLVFGGKCPKTSTLLRDAFTDAFSISDVYYRQ